MTAILENGRNFGNVSGFLEIKSPRGMNINFLDQLLQLSAALYMVTGESVWIVHSPPKSWAVIRAVKLIVF